MLVRLGHVEYEEMEESEGGQELAHEGFQGLP